MISLFIALFALICYACVYAGGAVILFFASLFVKPEPQPQPEFKDIWIYTELEAFSKQIKSERELVKQYQHEMWQKEFLNMLSTEERNKLNKKIADTEARVAGIEKKMRKIGLNYSIDVDGYL